jgi:hypothetical protein
MCGVHSAFFIPSSGCAPPTNPYKQHPHRSIPRTASCDVKVEYHAAGDPRARDEMYGLAGPPERAVQKDHPLRAGGARWGQHSPKLVTTRAFERLNSHDAQDSDALLPRAVPFRSGNAGARSFVGASCRCYRAGPPSLKNACRRGGIGAVEGVRVANMMRRLLHRFVHYCGPLTHRRESQPCLAPGTAPAPGAGKSPPPQRCEHQASLRPPRPQTRQGRTARCRGLGARRRARSLGRGMGSRLPARAGRRQQTRSDPDTRPTRRAM